MSAPLFLLPAGSSAQFLLISKFAALLQPDLCHDLSSSPRRTACSLPSATLSPSSVCFCLKSSKQPLSDTQPSQCLKFSLSLQRRMSKSFPSGLPCLSIFSPASLATCQSHPGSQDYSLKSEGPVCRDRGPLCDNLLSFWLKTSPHCWPWEYGETAKERLSLAEECQSSDITAGHCTGQTRMSGLTMLSWLVVLKW